MDTKQQQFEKDLNKLGTDIDMFMDDVKDNSKKQVQDLKDRWRALKEQWDLMAEASIDTWEDVREDLENDLEEIQTSYNNLKIELSNR
jgi:archaellum component FlaC